MSMRILHYPGAKWRIANWIIDRMPDHNTYLEPYFGSGAVLFSKPESDLETVNDIDGEIVNVFRQIREDPEKLAYKIRWTPHSREEYYASYEQTDDPMERARRFLVRCWQGRGGKTSHRTGWRSLIDRNGSKPTQEWNKIPERMLLIADRLKQVQIENKTAVELIKQYKRPGVLIYADPPYIMSTRTTTHYKHEMNEQDHEELLDALEAHPGPVMVSGYAHKMYDDRLKNWHRESTRTKADNGAIRYEILWLNQAAVEQQQQRQISLFE